MSKNYRWGILGAGRIAEKFCTAINFVEGSEVYAVASRDSNKANAYAEKYGASKSYDNYEALIADPLVDIIYIATPHAFHYEQTLACIRNNKPVLCEKPVALSLAQASAMTEAATAQNVFFMEGMWTSCMPFIAKIKSLISDDVIGKPTFVGANFGFTAPVDLDGRLYNKTLGGGAMMDVGIYPLFLATLILGEPSTIKAISKINSTGIDEYTSIILQYPDNASAQLLSSITFNTAIDAVIIGTNGRIEIKNPWFKATEITVHLNDGTTEDFSMTHGSNGFEHEIKEVMACLDNGLLQSGQMPHSLTLSISRIIAQVLQQAGISYEATAG